MQTNYFKTLLEAKQNAIKIEMPYNTHVGDDNKHTAVNEVGQKIWEIEKINDTMGWMISAYPNNLKINKTN